MLVSIGSRTHFEKTASVVVSNGAVSAVAGSWGLSMNGAMSRIEEYRLSVLRAAPFAPYLGVSFWTAWILATSGIRDYYSNASALIETPSAMHIETRVMVISLLVVCGILNIVRRPAFDACTSHHATLAAAVLASLGNVSLFFNLGLPIFHLGCFAVALGLASLLLRAGTLYARIHPWKGMILFMTSQMIGAAIYLIIDTGPGIAIIPLFCLLPLASALLMLLPKDGQVEPHPAEPQPVRSVADPQPRTITSPSVRAFSQLFFLVFAFRFAPNMGKLYIAAGQTDGVISLGITMNVLLKILFAGIFVLYGFVPRKKLDFSRVCYLSFALIALTLVAVPLLPGSFAALLYSLCGTLSGLMGNLAFCIFSSICYRTSSSVGTVFGFGYSAVFLGSLLGYCTGLAFGDGALLDKNGGFLLLGLAYLLLFFAVLLMPPSLMRRFNYPNGWGIGLAGIQAGRADGPSLAVASGAEWERLAGDASLGEDGHPENHYPGSHWDRCCRVIARNGGLTPREEETMSLLAKGLGYKEIASALGVSLNTTRSHSRSIYSKLGIHSRSELISMIEAMDR